MVNSILKWEGIVIDPVGAVLAVLVFGVAFGSGSDSSVGGVLLGLAVTLLTGFILGYGVALSLVAVLRRHWIPDYLQSAIILITGLLMFSVSNCIQHESGLLTVTVMGIGLANQSKAQVRHIMEFKENLRILLISTLFIILGGRISWQEVAAVWREALLFLLILIVVIRPAAVFVSTIGSRVTLKEKTFLAMMAPRGIVAAAVSSIFAIEIIGMGGVMETEGRRIAPVVFTVIVGTVLFYGLIAKPIARKLEIAMARAQGILFAGIHRWSIEAALALKDLGFRCLMIDSNYAATTSARMAGVAAVNANVLSEYATEELDLHGIGHFLAVTKNDQVNSLACIGLSHSLGRSNVYQFAPADHDRPERETDSGELRGRTLFAEGFDGGRIEAIEAGGASVRTTLLSDKFGWEDFHQHYHNNAVVLFILRADNSLEVMTPESREGEVGDTLISLCPEDGEK